MRRFLQISGFIAIGIGVMLFLGWIVAMAIGVAYEWQMQLVLAIALGPMVAIDLTLWSDQKKRRAEQERFKRYIEITNEARTFLDY